MNVAIVDDQEAERGEIRARLTEAAQERRVALNVREFDSAEAFMEAFAPRRFDAVFMDIYMGEMTGYEAAQRVYEADRQTRIVFLTTTEAFGAKSYAVRAADYIVKPITPELMQRALENCLPMAPAPRRMLSVTSSRMNFEIDFGDILYVDRVGRTVTLHLSKHALGVSGSFGQVTGPLMDDGRFILCYKGIVINLDYMLGMTRDGVKMAGGEVLPVSRPLKGEVMQRFLHHRAGSLREERR